MADINFLEQDLGDDDDDLLEDPPAEEAPPGEEPPGPTPAQLQQLQQQAQVMQRFNSDPAFARQVVMERARQLGLQIAEPAREQAPQGPPASYVDLVKQSLAPEMQFLAPQIATATWTATQAQIAPLRQQQEAQTEQQRQTTYDTMARELATEAPGWEQYEDEMLSILSFMRSAIQGQGAMTHPKYGSALKLLYRLASGEAQATATAGRRMATALRAGTRTSSGGGTRSTGPDLETMLAKAPTSQAKWGLAFNHALREHGVRG